MRTIAVAALLSLLSASAHAQAVICPLTPATGTNNILCANTAFVQKSIDPLKVPQTVIGSLPTCASAADGELYEVTNGVASPSYNAAVSATGTTHDLAFCNGTAWTYH